MNIISIMCSFTVILSTYHLPLLICFHHQTAALSVLLMLINGICFRSLSLIQRTSVISALDCPSDLNYPQRNKEQDHQCACLGHILLANVRVVPEHWPRPHRDIKASSLVLKWRLLMWPKDDLPL